MSDMPWICQTVLAEDREHHFKQLQYHSLLHAYNDYKLTSSPILRANSNAPWINGELDKYKRECPEKILCPMPGHGLSYSPRVLHSAGKGEPGNILRDGCLIIDRPFVSPFLVPVRVDCPVLMGVAGSRRRLLVGGDDTAFVRSVSKKPEYIWHEITLSTGDVKLAEKYWWCAYTFVVMRPGSTNEVYASEGWSIAVGKIRASEPSRVINIKAATLPFLEDEKRFKERLKRKTSRPARVTYNISIGHRPENTI
jgi:hypothetical protein